MGLGNESEQYEDESYGGEESERNVKVLLSGYKRLCEAKAAHEEKLISMDSLLRSVVATLKRMEIRAGKQTELPETSNVSPRGSVSFAPVHRGHGESNLVLDNRSSLLKRIEMPVFDGSQPYEWFSKVERFFSCWNVSGS